MTGFVLYTGLVHYDEACKAVAQACSIDEAKDIRNTAEALRIYARQVQNVQLQIDVTEIRLRAERRIGELMAEQRRAGGFSRGAAEPNAGCEQTRVEKRTLAAAGIDKNLAHRARELAAVPKKQFESLLVEHRSRVTRDNSKVTLNLLNNGVKAARRAAREVELGAKIRALPEKRYGLIVADPEWRYETWSRETGMDRAADNHYPTSTLDEIMARDVGSIAAADCCLGVWGTVPMLEQALRVMAAWGFGYVSHYIWDKVHVGTGYWNRGRHELLLIGTRGNVPCPAMGTQRSSVIAVPRTEHSAKPEVFLEMLEGYFPTVPKIELNRRGPARPGWDAWGNEAVDADEAAA